MKITLNILVALALVFVAGCGRIQSPGRATAAPMQMTLAVEPAQVVVTLADETGQPINNARIDIEGNMTHAGMIPVFAQARGGQNGRYPVPFTWTMGGDWVLTVKVTLPNGQTVTQQFPVTVQP